MEHWTAPPALPSPAMEGHPAGLATAVVYRVPGFGCARPSTCTNSADTKWVGGFNEGRAASGNKVPRGRRTGSASRFERKPPSAAPRASTYRCPQRSRPAGGAGASRRPPRSLARDGQPQKCRKLPRHVSDAPSHMRAPQPITGRVWGGARHWGPTAGHPRLVTSRECRRVGRTRSRLRAGSRRAK